MIITCLSDLHGFYPKLESGDLLIIAGDLTAREEPEEYVYFRHWLSKQDYQKRIVIAGNHDTYLEWDYIFGSTPFLEIADYLCDSGTEFKGLKIWGCPWTPRFFGMNPNCTAFTYHSEKWFYDEKIAKIPDDIDILITHGPSRGVLDKTIRGEHVGSTAIEKYLKYVNRPKLHAFGHIHEDYGIREKWTGNDDTRVTSVNCSIVNERYEHVNKPVTVVL